MPSPTMTLIQSVTVPSGGSAVITFLSIPSTFTDLCVKLSLRGADTGSYDVARMYFNGNQSISYSWKFIRGNGAAASSSSGSSTTGVFIGLVDCTGNTASTFSSQEVYIPNYLSSNNKSLSIDNVMEQNGTTAYAELNAGLAPLTSAITSISIFTETSPVQQFSTAYLYGVKSS